MQHRLQIQITEAQRADWQAEAELDGRALGAWIRNMVTRMLKHDRGR